MSSPNDNTQINNSLDSPVKLRTKDVSSAQDGSLQFNKALATPYPVDYGVYGIFHTTVKSGAVAAGLSAGAPIIAFRNSSALINALVRRIKLRAWSTGTGFAAGLITFEMYVARSFTVMDTGGAPVTLTAPQAKLATAMGVPLCAIQAGSTAGLTAGTRTLDTLPIEAKNFGANTATYTLQNPPDGLPLFEKLGAEHPLLLASNEGFVIQATVPATGTWAWSAAIEWDEVPVNNF